MKIIIRTIRSSKTIFLFSKILLTQTIHNEVKRGTTLQQVRKGLYKK
ncbi:IS30 family transposase, partial [Streptococcus pneumoniae]